MPLRPDNSKRIQKLPKHVKKKILNHFSATDFINGAQTSKLFYSFFYDEYTLARNLQRQLLSHAALGEWVAAERIWKKSPELLTQRGTIYHPNRIYADKQKIDIPVEKNPGRYKYVNVTAWQIALMNEEYEEAKMMTKFMSFQERQKQFEEIFPDGKIVTNAATLANTQKLLQAVMDALEKDPSPPQKLLSQYRKKSLTMSRYQMGCVNEVTQQALNALYQHVKPKDTHSEGIVCDINIYIAALKMFEKCKLKNKLLEDKYIFWVILVEEYLASLLGTRYLRPHAQGYCQKLQRTGCVLADSSPYFSFRQTDVKFLPGTEYFINRWGMREGYWRKLESMSRDIKDSEFYEKLARENRRWAHRFEQKYGREEKKLCKFLCGR